MGKKNNKTKKFLIVLFIIAFGLGLASYMYINDYYRASSYVDDLIASSSNTIETRKNLTKITSNELVSDSFEESIGLIFYPGGKVEAKAYMPLLLKLSDIGITTVLVEMPANLAVLDIKAADDIYAKYPEIDKWYIAGHSLGGAMASSYMEKNYEKVEGLILMGAYPINEAAVDTLAIYGTHDIMLDLDKVVSADEVYEIVDGNHAQFGDYGEQEGDGLAKISREDQQKQAIKRIKEFISKDSK
ncbi:MAG: alpha/beta hydrolase [Acidaminobacteraceae bacterium]